LLNFFEKVEITFEADFGLSLPLLPKPPLFFQGSEFVYWAYIAEIAMRDLHGVTSYLFGKLLLEFVK